MKLYNKDDKKEEKKEDKETSKSIEKLVKKEEKMEGFYPDLENQDYHDDTTHLSSSSLKMLLKKPEEFHSRYILKEKQIEQINTNFIFGNYCHSLVLEPHKTDDEFAIYPGKVRRGKEYEGFSAANEGKEIITQAEVDKAKLMYLGFKQDKFADEMISGGKAEVSLFTDLDGVNVKVRADYLFTDIYSGYIADLKTTYTTLDIIPLMRVIGERDYDLSAALYVDCYTQQLGMPFNFYFVFMSKDMKSKLPICRVVKASEQMLQNGRDKVKQALNQYKASLKSGIWFEKKKVIPIEDFYPEGNIQDIYMFRRDLYYDKEQDEKEIEELAIAEKIKGDKK